VPLLLKEGKCHNIQKRPQYKQLPNAIKENTDSDALDTEENFQDGRNTFPAEKRNLLCLIACSWASTKIKWLKFP